MRLTKWTLSTFIIDRLSTLVDSIVKFIESFYIYIERYSVINYDLDILLDDGLFKRYALHYLLFY